MSQTLYFVSLTLFSMGFFGTAQGWEGGVVQKCPSFLKSVKFPTKMKLDTIISGLKKILKRYDISGFSQDISKFSYIKKSRYKLDFDS